MSNPKSPESDVAALVGAAPRRTLVDEYLTPDFVDDGNCCAGKLESLSSKVKEAGEPGAVAVKPLEWRYAPVPPCGEWLAPSAVGLYCVPLGRAGYTLRFRDREEVGDFHTLDEAKAAAQADYETRIRSALLPAAALKGEAVAGDGIVARLTLGFVDKCWRELCERNEREGRRLHATMCLISDEELREFMERARRER
jgi:hypothetical protein